jgi:hypothetical protein
MKTVIILVSIGSLLYNLGCQKSLSPTNSEELPEIEITNKKSVGIKLENPYTVESMLRARDNLEAKGVIAYNLTDDEFQPTHY